MAFKKPNKKKSRKSVRVKNSYYSFSKEYPGGVIGTPGKRAKKKAGKQRIFLAVASVVGFILIFCVSYLIAETGLRFSYKQPDEIGLSDTVTAGSEQNVAFETVKALYMPSEKLSDTGYIKRLIRNIRRKDYNSVVIDFKTENGNLSFFSNSDIALLAKCSSVDNETVEKAIEIFENAGIRIIGRFFCFQDAIVSESNPELAVKYMSSDVLWLDKPESEGGKPYLNPYSKQARNYLIDTVRQVNGFGIRYFILEDADFPDGAGAETAGFPGEKKKSGRGTVLLDFVNEVKASLTADSKLILSFSADDLLSGGSYSELLIKSNADAICADTLKRPETYVVDKSTDYSSMISLFSQLKQKTSENKPLVLQIDSGEYSWRYVKAIKKSGFENVVIYNEKGEY